MDACFNYAILNDAFLLLFFLHQHRSCDFFSNSNGFFDSLVVLALLVYLFREACYQLSHLR